MSRHVVYLIALAAILCAGFAVAGCAGAPVQQPGEQPGEQPEEQPGEQPEEQPGEQPEEQPGEQPEEQPGEQPQEQPREGETPLEKQAREELAGAIAKGNKLAGQKKFNEALAELGAVIAKYEGSPIVEGAKKAHARIELAKEKDAGRQHLEVAKAAYEAVIMKCDAKVQQNKFREALLLLESYPAGFAETEFPAMVKSKAKEVQVLYTRWKEHQELLKAAQRKCMELDMQAQELVKQDRFQDALDLLDGYPQEYAKTQWGQKVKESRAGIETLKAQYEEEQQFKAEALAAYRDAISGARGLVEEKKFDEAVALLQGFPEKYEELGYGTQLEQEAASIQSKKEQYEEEQFQKAAREKYDETVAAADKLAGENKFDEALSALGSYPAQYYSTTEWPEKIVQKRAQVEADKAAHEKEQKRLSDAADEAQRIIAEADELAAKNEFTAALDMLKAYPQEYSDTDSQAQVTSRTQDIEAKEAAYKKRQTTMGIVIAAVIVVLLVIVIAVSTRKKGGGPQAAPPVAAAGAEPEYQPEPQGGAAEPAEVEPEPVDVEPEPEALDAEEAPEEGPPEEKPGQQGETPGE